MKPQVIVVNKCDLPEVQEHPPGPEMDSCCRVSLTRASLGSYKGTTKVLEHQGTYSSTCIDTLNPKS